MKIALYFGSFNPVHNGHLIIANHVAQMEDLNEVWFVVSPQNPFKKENQLLNANHRLQMIRLAIENESKIKASNVEFKLPTPSYTVNTLIYLKELYPKNEFVIVLGSDGFQNISKWKNIDFIIENYEFYIYQRPGFEIVNSLQARIRILDSPQILISATYIRKLLSTNKSISFLVPETVKEEIEKNKYYLSKSENPSQE